MHVVRSVSFLLTGLILAGCAQRVERVRELPPPKVTRLPASPVSASSKQWSLDEHLTAALHERMAVLESRHKVKFDVGVLPRLRFELPTQMHPMVPAGQFCAHYDLESQSIVVHPKYREEAKKNGRSALRFIFDHELGHLFADQLSRRLGLGMFPPLGYEQKPMEEQLGVELISEGIASYFEATDTTVTLSYAVLPESGEHPVWSSPVKRSEVVYSGGYWLVKPIIEGYGQQGVAYLLRTPLLIPADRNAQAACKQYQVQALSSLAALFPAQGANAPEGSRLKLR